VKKMEFSYMADGNEIVHCRTKSAAAFKVT
jgi:hypothetical protein